MARLLSIAMHQAADVSNLLAALLATAPWAQRPRRREHVYSGGAVACCGWTEPDVFQTSDVTVMIDGHVYNRDALGAAGENCAALVAVLYVRHGFSDAIRLLNGDFAIVLHDRIADTWWLARDRFGVKPLYYVQTAAGFACASQPKVLLSFPGVDDGLNRRFVGLFAGCHYRYIDHSPEESPFASVRQLPAAHVLRLRGRSVDLYRYWALSESPDISGTEVELAATYRALLLDAVAIRVDAGRDRAAFTLSGGMDSSSVLASAVHITGRRQHAFSTVYDDPTYDESTEISSMLNDCVEEWHPIRVGSPDVPALVERMLEAHDEPVATATWLSHFVLCESVARSGFQILFGGLGGDELNAGEYEHFIYHFADLRRAGHEAALDREIECWVRHHNHPVFRKSRAVAEHALERLVDFGAPGRCRPDRTRLERYADAVNREYFDIRAFEPEMLNPFTSYLKNRTLQDLVRETVPCCLRAEDRGAEAFGLDVRLPFFDHRLAEFMFRISGTLKFRDGVSKFLLREAMRGILPEPTRTRIKKTGWNAPAHVWFAGEGRTMLQDLVRSRQFRERGVYNVREVQRLIDEHNAIVGEGRPQDNHMMFLWQLLNLELWMASLERRTSQHATAGVLPDA
jgi:asparagine synthase (glutamine-hydrolysing)